jgi:hypothetical protein
MHLTTLSPPAFIGDGLLFLLLHLAMIELSWDDHSRKLAFTALGAWMFVSKFIKLLGHYIRYPRDFVFLPVSILFGYFHGFIKLYAGATLHVVSLIHPSICSDSTSPVAVALCLALLVPLSLLACCCANLHSRSELTDRSCRLHECSLTPTPSIFSSLTFDVNCVLEVQPTMNTNSDFVQTAWGSREGADADDGDRMAKFKPIFEDEKLPLFKDEKSIS